MLLSRQRHEQPAHSLGETQLRVSLWRTPRTRALLPVGAVAVVAGCVALAARIYTDVLWFREVSQESVYWTTPEQLVMRGPCRFALIARLLSGQSVEVPPGGHVTLESGSTRRRASRPVGG